MITILNQHLIENGFKTTLTNPPFLIHVLNEPTFTVISIRQNNITLYEFLQHSTNHLTFDMNDPASIQDIVNVLKKKGY